MRTSHICRPFLWAALALLLLLPGFAQAERPDTAPGTRKIVTFAPGLGIDARTALLQEAGVKKLKHLPLIDGAAVEADDSTTQALLNQPGVLRVADDVVAYAVGKPPKPAPSGDTLPWGVNRVDAELVWDADGNGTLDAGAVTGAGVRVAVVDTGIDLDHPDLMANIKGGYNAINPASSPEDDNGHGTHVAGTIAAADNEKGVIGVAPQAELYAVKVLGADGSGWISDIIAGLEWCVNHHIQVVNMSLGASIDVEAFHQAVTAAANAGIVLVAAAGNDRNYVVNYPAAYPEVIAVTATKERRDQLASFNCYGPEVDLAAPGESILSTYIGGTYATGSGTSMASPHVAGTAALVLAAGITDQNGNGRVNDDVQQVLQATAQDLGDAGYDIKYGYGLVQADAAVAGVR